MPLQIQNKELSAAFNCYGAELCSLRSRTDDTEYIWQADPQHWARHAPVLFPIVGSVKNGLIIHNNQNYGPLGQHGFARDSEFTIVEQGADSITFELVDSEETLAIYPFPFSLRISYLLQGNQLVVRYFVKNPADSEMLFSIGAHPAFNCPLRKEEKRSDYSFVFSQHETAATHRLSDGLFDGRTGPILDDQKTLPIADDLFDKNALVFKNLCSDSISLVDGAGQTQISIQFPGFPYLGLWSPSVDAPFVCIEPWYGLADYTDAGELRDKEGILCLSSKDQFFAEYSIVISME